jgi:signal transduction histidine kinase
MKYSPSDRPIELTFRYNPVALESKEAQVVFQIRDRGIGIPPEDKQRLFETFHRAQNVGTIAGTGLGLAIVKKCVEIHQGQIAIDSEVGVGTTVTVTLPISAQGYGET